MDAREPGEGPEDERPLLHNGRDLACWLERNLLRIDPYPVAGGTMTRLLAAWMILVRGSNVLPQYQNWGEHRRRANQLDQRDWRLYYSGLFLP